ncbi:membrane or secreted protein [gut metagenome]|uniref:Membrane or secreted protein n=1 Tax=gut metagenome TaxID=749906 RepID=J9H368_9ZZZZ
MENKKKKAGVFLVIVCLLLCVAHVYTEKTAQQTAFCGTTLIVLN